MVLAHGVTGNTSDFGSEESRFEPWSDNEKELLTSGFFCTLKFGPAFKGADCNTFSFK